MNEQVNCGRCAHLWNREPNHPGFGRCACLARQHQLQQLRPMVELVATCEHAQLSAKFDPEFLPALRLSRRGFVQPSCLAPTPQTHPVHADETRFQDTL